MEASKTNKDKHNLEGNEIKEKEENNNLQNNQNMPQEAITDTCHRLPFMIPFIIGFGSALAISIWYGVKKGKGKTEATHQTKLPETRLYDEPKTDDSASKLNQELKDDIKRQSVKIENLESTNELLNRLNKEMEEELVMINDKYEALAIRYRTESEEHLETKIELDNVKDKLKKTGEKNEKMELELKHLNADCDGLELEINELKEKLANK